MVFDNLEDAPQDIRKVIVEDLEKIKYHKPILGLCFSDSESERRYIYKDGRWQFELGIIR